MSKFRNWRKRLGRGEGQCGRAQCGQDRRKRRNGQVPGQAAGGQEL